MALPRARFIFVFVVTVVLLYMILVYYDQPVSNIQYGVQVEQGEDGVVCRDCNKYCYTSPYGKKMVPLDGDKLRQIGCEQRLPQALIIGVKKSGTTALKHFVSFHPQIASPVDEVHFFDNRYFMGMDWYISQMPYALKNQTVLEKTPRYFVWADAPDRVRKDLASDVRMIVVLRDPIGRAVSDFVHIQFKRHLQEVADNGGKPVKQVVLPLTPELKKKREKQKISDERNNKAIGSSMYEVTESFEDSVIDADGNVKGENSLIDTGIYVKYLRRWYEKFPRDQILVMDGIDLIKNPCKAMKSVEDFLGLQPHFTEKHFYFDPVKHFYCLALPVKACMSASKGRTHPEVSQEVTDKLRNFYKPFDRELEELTGQRFSWVERD
ncbi:heparan sulfate glucosamine 3-O-sulfotransferase 5-like [Anneissia japonica]|uniref:heparan sulfate glucosamine 3-O-sulfotransferase 5-like n=1 Tax=Anneissia japonica TaxID=1529436 RepID=UPI0014255157|nr:heparan sulfate glucosamine 3-O-sulfotransferase 5-like [Anneissia japonica]XP_033101775.1 heparan sulfate glucosamine 3-O-sulfotransferase 5-like [Anneissia japonica]XP_033101777.1 heparan sulfate glucosamine 3-O-sulfotransferase 5-like [Anneissia japonica]